MPPKGRPENLTPVRSKKEATERGRNGGIKSGQVRKEKKLISQMLAETISEMYDEPNESKNLKSVLKAIMNRKDSASVQLLKTAIDSSEGQKLEITGTQIVYLDKQDENL